MTKQFIPMPWNYVLVPSRNVTAGNGFLRCEVADWIFLNFSVNIKCNKHITDGPQSCGVIRLDGDDDNACFYFKTYDQAILFKLTWGGE